MSACPSFAKKNRPLGRFPFPDSLRSSCIPQPQGSAQCLHQLVDGRLHRRRKRRSQREIEWLNADQRHLAVTFTDLEFEI